ncbi:MAG: DUF4919 domain-containing protein [Muribaculaceae bacterium]|nr:DUF4919 domain-containing protein [Muribaculaceae bacterium]
MKTLRIIMAAAILTLTSLYGYSAKELNITRSQIENTVRTEPARYKALAERFSAADASLTPEEVATVYYGQAYVPGFNAAMAFEDVERAYAAGDYAEALELIDKAVEAQPAVLSLLFKGYGAASSIGRPDRAASYQKRLLDICEVIFASGKGVSDMSPYVVVRPSDRDEFIAKYLQPTSIIGSSKLGTTDAVKMKLDGVADDVILYFRPL